MIVFLCAMKEEVAEIIPNIKSAEAYSIFRTTFYKGTLEGKNVLVGTTGIGKVFSAAVTQKICENFLPHAIVFLGIAGAVKDNLNIGDIVVSHDCMQYDMDATAMGFKIGEIPYTGIDKVEADKTLKQLAMSFKVEGKKIVEGRILTGDRFVVTKTAEERAFFRDILSGSAVEMEGAACGFVAHINNIPFVVVRVISDKADGNAPEKFREFLHNSSLCLADMAHHICCNIV